MTTQYQYLAPGFDHSALRLDDGTQRLVADFIAGNLNAEQMARHRYQMNKDKLDAMSTDSLAPGNGPVFANELEHMLEEMQVEFEDLDLFRLFATDTRVPAGARTYAVKRTEVHGGAEWYTGNSSNVPTPSMSAVKEDWAVNHIATGLKWNHLESQSAGFAGLNLRSNYEEACDRAVAEFMNDKGWDGDETVGALGVLNNPFVPRVSLGETIADATDGDAIEAAMHKVTTLNAQMSKQKRRPSRMILPPRLADYLAHTDKSTQYDRSILESFEGRNRYIRSIETTHELEAKGPNGEDVIILDFGANVRNGFGIVVPQGLVYLPIQRFGMEYSQIAFAAYGGVTCHEPLNQMIIYVTIGDSVAGA